MYNIFIKFWVDVGQGILVAILDPNFIIIVRVPVVKKNIFCLFIGQKRVDILYSKNFKNTFSA